jgi:hypothetical protein
MLDVGHDEYHIPEKSAALAKIKTVTCMAEARSTDEPSKSAGIRSIDSGISPASSPLSCGNVVVLAKC